MSEKSFDENRHDQLTTAPKASEADAAPRVTVEERSDGIKRIDVAETAAVCPGNPE
ncbi:multidrug transporter [Cryobacterium sp. PAMC25264]|uniref:multidrug transporter n=1 Tax=Cryobacterium sp. PAMC25264 TaxID=2861288 RepID=UPI001C62D6EF|nr:multidrug transporter [Cryobacterium sp. PAMC25264]QYF73766.1 multidrug transporter [Cryobacterium sp. PAMC25264]